VQDDLALFGEGSITTYEKLTMSRILVQEEVEQYLALPPMPLYVSTLGEDGLVHLLPFNVLHWWQQHEAHFPRLASLARHHLSLLGSSMPSKHAFSLAEWMFTTPQTALKDFNMEALLFLNINSNHYPSLP